GRGDQRRPRPDGARDRGTVAAGRPREEPLAENEMRRAVVQYEGAVREVVERRPPDAPCPGDRVEPLVVEPRVDRGRPDVPVEVAPGGREVDVVRVAAEGAGPVPGGERRRLVEEEQLGELAGLQQRRAVPVLVDEPAGDPPPHLV